LKAISLVFAAALAGCTAGAYQRPGTYQNPVLARDFPDPAVLRAPDGWFYAYATQTPVGNAMLNIQVARSHDLVDWQHLGDALPQKPVWGATKQNFWAPHVTHDAESGRYLMYYSAEPDHVPGKCLAVATAQTPAGPFIDSGVPLRCGEKFEHIDPMAFDDPQTGKHLLYWGSGFKPIRVQELAPHRMGFMPASTPVEVIAPGADFEYGSLVEAAWVTFRDGFYYLFYSSGLCCGLKADYQLRVARSRSALGPFERHDKAILEHSGFWRAPGHASIVTDARGNDWALYHAIDAARAYYEDSVTRRSPARVMLLDRIEYREGWPRIHNDRPSVTRQAAPAVDYR
jgi:arabinan endo-1,5-alpha-L-arabinosidase